MKVLTRPSLSPLWPALLLAGVLAAWIDLGDYHRWHCSDSLVPVLTSLYRWTPFFWGCNRIGMLVPLLAMPFQHPLTNLLVQCWLVLFATFAVLVLLPRYLLRTAAWPGAAVLGIGLFLVLLSEQTRYSSTFTQPHYPVALALGVGALLLIESAARADRLARGLAALVLILLAGWVNSATPAFLGPLVLCRYLLARFRPADSQAVSEVLGWRRRLLRLGRRAWDGETVCALALLAIGAVVSSYFRNLIVAQDDPVPKGFNPVEKWPLGWWQLALSTWGVVVEPRRAVHVAFAVVLGARIVHLLCCRSHVALRAALALVIGGGTYGLAMGTLHWVEMNSYCFKYWIPVIFYLLAGAAMILAPQELPSLRSFGWRLALPGLAAGTLLLLAALEYGRPSLARVRAGLDGMLTETPLSLRMPDLLATRCTHVVGSYRDVWPTVFYLNLNLREQGEHRVVWGVAGRAMATWKLWGYWAPEDLRVAVLREGGKDRHPDAGFWLDNFLPPMIAEERRPTLTLLRTPGTCCVRPSSADSPPAPLLLSWHSGFYTLEGTPQWNYRWCDAHGKLTITNPSNRPRQAVLDMELLTAAPWASRIHVHGPGLDKTLTVDHDRGPFTHELTVPPGSTTFVFDCEAPGLSSIDYNYHDDRVLVFRVKNFLLTEPRLGDDRMASAATAPARD